MRGLRNRTEENAYMQATCKTWGRCDDPELEIDLAAGKRPSNPCMLNAGKGGRDGSGRFIVRAYRNSESQAG